MKENIFHVGIKDPVGLRKNLLESSKDADLILLGMAEPTDQFVTYYERLRSRTEGLPSTIFVLAAEEIAFREVLIKPQDKPGE